MYVEKKNNKKFNKKRIIGQDKFTRRASHGDPQVSVQCPNERRPHRLLSMLVVHTLLIHNSSFLLPNSEALPLLVDVGLTNLPCGHG